MKSAGSVGNLSTTGLAAAELGNRLDSNSLESRLALYMAVSLMAIIILVGCTGQPPPPPLLLSVPVLCVVCAVYVLLCRVCSVFSERSCVVLFCSLCVCVCAYMQVSVLLCM